jgi:hypothetical protein
MMDDRRRRQALLTLAPACLTLGLIAAGAREGEPGFHAPIRAEPPVDPIGMEAPEVVQLQPGETLEPSECCSR